MIRTVTKFAIRNNFQCARFNQRMFMQARPMICMMPVKMFSTGVPPNKDGWSPVANDEGEAAAI